MAGVRMPKGDGRGYDAGGEGRDAGPGGSGGKEVVGTRVDLVWKEESQGGGKDSPQVDTIAKSHQVQVSRCLHVPRKGTEGRG